MARRARDTRGYVCPPESRNWSAKGPLRKYQMEVSSDEGSGTKPMTCSCFFWTVDARTVGTLVKSSEPFLFFKFDSIKKNNKWTILEKINIFASWRIEKTIGACEIKRTTERSDYMMILPWHLFCSFATTIWTIPFFRPPGPDYLW